MGQWNIQERARGVRDALKEKYPKVQVLAECDDKGNVALAPQANAAMITAHPDLAGIVGLDAASGIGIARAVVEAGKKGKIKIVCFDRDDDMLPADSGWCYHGLRCSEELSDGVALGDDAGRTVHDWIDACRTGGQQTLLRCPRR